MATLYLKNVSGSKKVIGDLGIVLANNQSTIIDSNNIDGYLTSEMQAALLAGPSSGLVLSTTDIGNSSGDLTPEKAVAALTITTRFDTDNPHKTTFSQVIAQETDTNVTAAELERLSNGTDASAETELHHHDTRYYTKTQLTNSNPGSVSVHWDNIINAPAFGALSWQSQALVRVLGFSDDPSLESWDLKSGDFYISTINNHIYRYDGAWNDYFTPSHGDRIINLSDNHIYTFDTVSENWIDTSTPEDNWALLVNNDGDGKPSQYIYDIQSSSWLKIADIDWGDHNSLAGRDSVATHPAQSITFDNSLTTLKATTVQAALEELGIETSTKIDNIIYVAKNGQDTISYPNSVENLGSITLPFLTIQAAINAIPTTGPKAVSATNRYAIIVSPGNYNENISLSKQYVYLTGFDRTSSKITSSTGTTLTLSSSTENVNGVYNITIESTSTNYNDAAILLSGNNQEIKNVIVNAPNGAKAINITGTYTQRLQQIVINSGETKVDAGVSNFNTVHSKSKLNVSGGTVKLVDCNFSSDNDDALVQVAGTIYYISGKLESGVNKLDINQDSGTIYFGWVEYDNSKVSIEGTKLLLFKSQDLSYSNAISGLNSTQVQSAIDELVNRTSSQLTKYIVGKDSFDKYSTIQSAIDSAISDGHKNTNPALILVKPGVYTGNINLVSGIHLISLENTDPSLTKINGTLTYSSTEALGNASIQGFEIDGTSNTAISIEGSLVQTLNVSNCNLYSSSTNPVVSINNESANVVLKENDIINSSSGKAIDLVNGTLAAYDSILDSTAISFAAANSSLFTGEGINFGGSITFLNSSLGVIKNSTIDNGTSDAISFNSTSQLLLIDTINLGTGILASGTKIENVIIRKNAYDIPYDNSISQLSATSVQAAIDELVKEFNVELDNVVYVAKNGNDSATGVKIGTISNPFLTVQAAINSILDASSSKVYVVMVLPGRYLENVTFKPWVNIVGITKEATVIASGSEGTHSCTFTTGGRILFKDLALGGSNQNIVITHPTGAPGGVSVTFDNVNLGTPTFNMLGGGVDYVQLRNDFYCFGKATIHSANVTAFNGIFMNGVLIDDVGVEHLDVYGSASSNTIKDCMGAELKCVGNVWTEFYNNYSWDKLISDGVQCTVSYDVQSAPDSPSNLQSVNGGKFQRTDNAFAIGYDNSTSGLTSTEVQSAIDELKASITSFKMPKGTQFPIGPVDGDLFYRTDMSMPFQFDGTRNKWLSMSKQTLDWGASSADGKYLNIHGATATQTGYLMPRKGTVISITIKIASGNLTKPVELRKNNAPWSGTPSQYTFTPIAGTFSKTDLNIDFEATDYIQAFCPSNAIAARDIVVMIEIAYRD